ncbi:hypothetical protein EYC59_00125 [Candidatus Saccharibacteria bacterium]|nr:MAG: hypothetical protein EYC59_00125 [Candidatus Saccharibacteria bacterium]
MAIETFQFISDRYQDIDAFKAAFRRDHPGKLPLEFIPDDPFIAHLEQIGMTALVGMRLSDGAIDNTLCVGFTRPTLQSEQISRIEMLEDKGILTPGSYSTAIMDLVSNNDFDIKWGNHLPRQTD